jgi:GalNAc-alpha-(1->4)-GalNAc-alpha-(1->3)-diNAcBac-PP-undecaprenol alpha-1,4-N-acetyl-D-galactosaminyltransferase
LNSRINKDEGKERFLGVLPINCKNIYMFNEFSHQSKPTITFILGSMSRGGAERVTSILANDFSTRGYLVHIILLLNNGCAYQLNDDIKLQCFFDRHKSRLVQLPHLIFKLRNYFTVNKPDYVVSFFTKINLISIIASLGIERKKLVISERNDPASNESSLFYKLMISLLYPLADCVLFQTEWAQSNFPKKIISKSIIIPNPINVNAKSAAVKKKKIVSVGRLMPVKNHKLLIDAFKRVAQEYPEYHLIIYGEGGLRKKLTEQIRNLDLEKNVQLPGYKRNIHEEISDAEMFVLSSNSEGLSNALLEAMMVGLPCISTEYNGANEVIENGFNGLLVPVGSVDKLSEAMLKLITDKQLAHFLANNGQMSSEKFNAQFVLEQWRSVIESEHKMNTINFEFL